MNKKNEILNVPNILSLIRIACTPLIVLMFLLPIPNGIGVFIAMGLYILGCLTDTFDGIIARKYNLITDFGKFIDQIADKFITTTAMVLVLFSSVTYTWLSVILLLVVVLRDIFVSGVRMIAANKGIVIAADMIGKVKSFLLDVGNVVLMFFIGLRACGQTGTFVKIIQILGLSLVGISVILALVSGVLYSVKAFKALNKEPNNEENKK